MSAAVHQQWAIDFCNWASIHAFGPSTVTAEALRNHALEYNSVVQAAAKAVEKAQAIVNETAMALPYKATPIAHIATLDAAKAELRKALRAARYALDGAA